MKTYVSILRGINVTGHRKILMADLKALYEHLQFKDVQTYIQSGNVIFRDGSGLSDKALAARIEGAIDKKYGFQVPVIIRSVQEMKEIHSLNPFVGLKDKEVNKLYVTFLSETPTPANRESILKTSFLPDEFIIIDKNIFLCIPVSYGLTKLSNNFFEKKLQVKATTRNWNTVQQLLELSLQKK